MSARDKYSAQGSLSGGGGKHCTVNLLVLTSLEQLPYIENIIKTTFLNEEVNCTEPPPSVGVPCLAYFTT